MSCRFGLAALFLVFPVVAAPETNNRSEAQVAVVVTQAPGAEECQRQLLTAKAYVAALEKQVAALNDEVRALTAERDDLKKKLDECKHKYALRPPPPPPKHA